MWKKHLAAIVGNFQIYSPIVTQKLILQNLPSKKSAALAPISYFLFHFVARTWKESMAII